MKTGIKTLFLLPTLIVALGLTPAGRVSAQTFTNLHSFNNSDGSHLQAGLVLSRNTLYGAADSGGDAGHGTVFKVNTDGSGFTSLYSFTGGDDGENPDGTLVLSGTTLYGTAFYGGMTGNGSVYAINTDGTGFTNIYSFTGGSDGAYPEAGLVLSGTTLYGTTEHGGISNGVVFAVNTDGTGFTNLHTFKATSGPKLTNSDGAIPQALFLSGNTLYGTALIGGNLGGGVVFSVKTNGSGFTNLHKFTAATLPVNLLKTSAPSSANSDGSLPGTLILSGNILYGTAAFGGSAGRGTVFALNANGTGFTNLHNFTATSGSNNSNSDGANPLSGWHLVLAGNMLYGTTYFGGSAGNGTVFAINTNGKGFTNLHSFTAESSGINSDGANPYSGLTLSGNTLYGTAKWGGISGYGTVFSVPLGPVLAGIRFAANFVLMWPTNATGFSLQSTTNLGPAAVWGTNLAAPVVVNGQKTVTNHISGTHIFYRLSK